MADGVPITAGAGTTVATDDCGASGHAQVVKLAYSADGVATLAPVDADGLLVNLGTNNDVTVAGVSTAANQTTGNTSLATIAGAVAGTEMQVDVLTMPAITGTVTANAGTNLNTSLLALESGGNLATIAGDTTSIQTAVELIDDTVHVLGTATYTEAATKGLLIGAVRRDADTTLVDTTNEITPLQVDANGRLKVEAFSGETLPVTLTSTTITGTVAVTQSGTWDEVGINDSGNSITVDWNGTAPPIGAGVEATALRVTIATDSTGVVSIDDNGGSLTVDAAAGGLIVGDGTNPVVVLADGADNVANTNNQLITASMGYVFDGTTWDRALGNATDGTLVNLGANNDVTVTSGTITLAAGTNTNEVVGDVAHSVAAAGNPVLIAGVAQAHDDTAPPNRVDAESDATRLATDFDGALFVRPHGPQVWSYHLNTSTAQTDASVHAAPGAGLSLYVGTIVFSSGAATAINMFLEEGASTIMGPYYLEAVAGRGMAVQFNPPRKITANTALTITTSASIAHSVDITGFTAQG